MCLLNKTTFTVDPDSLVAIPVLPEGATEEQLAEIAAAMDQLLGVFEALPFGEQIRWIGRVRLSRIRLARYRREVTHCLECGCLLSEGCIPGCGEVYQPRRMMVAYREEAGIIAALTPAKF